MFRGGCRQGAWAILIAILFVVGCGSSSTINPNLNEGGGGGGGGTGITNTFSSPSEMSVGDIMNIEFNDSEQATVDFSGVSSSSDFILAIGSYNSSGSGTSMSLSSNIALPDVGSLADEGMVVRDAVSRPETEIDEADLFGPQEMMHAWLRASESVLVENEVPVNSRQSQSLSKSFEFKAAALGATETFRVLSSLSSTTSYVDVIGEVRCLKDNVAFYVETSVSDSILSDADIDTLCTEFDDVAETEQELFGNMSDVDGDGKLHILMTKQVNRLGAMGGGIITGYFYAGDLYSRSSSNPVTNYREIIYTMVPDPTGAYGTTVSHDFAMSNLLPAVLPHELQHAINYNQHVFVNGGVSEENWLNEGMSHLAEDVLGYGIENPSRYAMFLASPSSYGVVTQGSPNLIERGASYLFLRFLYEQSSNGSALLKALEDTSLRGVSNVENAFGGPTEFNEFSEFMARWTLALAMTDRGITQDSRYVYDSRTRHATTGNWQGACISCDADDNRGTTLSGANLNYYYGGQTSSIDSSAMTYYTITTVPENIRLAGSSGGGNFGILIRTQ